MRKSATYLLVMTILMTVMIMSLSSCADPIPDATPIVPQATDEPDEPIAEQTPTVEPPTPTTEPLAAVVNGSPISLAEFEKQVARYEASMVAAGQDLESEEGKQALSQGRQWVLDLMIEQSLIEQSAAEKGVVIDDMTLDSTIASLRDEIGEEAFTEWLEKEGMTLEEMRERLRSDMVATQMANQVAESVPTIAGHVHARHILVDTKEEAEAIRNQILAGGDFEALARTYSQDISTRDVGGNLGFFPIGVLTSTEVEQAAFSLEPGQVSEVISSNLGFHIVQVVAREQEREIDPESLRLLRDKAVREWLDDLKSSGDIQIFILDTP
ncbi:MAG: peptidylprolyl isomerase [Anaerolineae bacterium]|nr:peptidylprolyl isomerase [Anaerolineae bacterium]